MTSDTIPVTTQRAVQHRCPNIGRHYIGDDPVRCGCPEHQPLATPCDECYSIIVTTQWVPYRPSEPWADVTDE